MTSFLDCRPPIQQVLRTTGHSVISGDYARRALVLAIVVASVAFRSVDESIPWIGIMLFGVVALASGRIDLIGFWSGIGLRGRVARIAGGATLLVGVLGWMGLLHLKKS